jgi:exodeoxyribonuclease V alpha subunit
MPEADIASQTPEVRVWLQWVQQQVALRNGKPLDESHLALIRALWLASSQGHVAVPVSRAQVLALEQAGLLGADPVVVVEHGRLYLPRWSSVEARLAAALLARVRQPAASEALATLDESLCSALDDDQRAFVKHALSHRLTLLTGGPGTGKTRTIVAFLQTVLRGLPATQIAVVAPTGKAASRLNEGLSALGAPIEATTVHRLLGWGVRHFSALDLPRPINPGSVFHAHQHLAHRVVVIDEASMLGLELATSLLEACAPHCHVVIAGDRDQLASVEPGAVFAHMVDALGAIRLRTNYRQAQAPELAGLLREVREGAMPEPAQLHPLLLLPDEHVLYRTLQSLMQPLIEQIAAMLSEPLELQGLALRQLLSTSKVLCAQRVGPYGVQRINTLAQAMLGLHASFAAMAPRERPELVIVRKNLDRLGLANGDIGLAVNHPHGPVVAFSHAEHCRLIPRSQLPELEQAWALTVHQAQGSEYDQILLILPQAESVMNTRELLYTGLTRAKSRAQVFGNIDQWRAAVQRTTQRDGALMERLN